MIDKCHFVWESKMIHSTKSVGNDWSYNWSTVTGKFRESKKYVLELIKIQLRIFQKRLILIQLKLIRKRSIYILSKIIKSKVELLLWFLPFCFQTDVSLWLLGFGISQIYESRVLYLMNHVKDLQHWIILCKRQSMVWIWFNEAIFRLTIAIVRPFVSSFLHNGISIKSQLTLIINKLRTSFISLTSAHPLRNF